MRTSNFQILVRTFVILFLISCGIARVWTAVVGTSFSFFMPFVFTITIMVLYMGFGWAFVRAGMSVLHRNDPNYQRFRENGGDPYFASLPWPLNPDSHTTRVTGRQEPRTAFVPPNDWKYQCPQCGARVQHKIDICWNCNYGAASNDAPPPPVNDGDDLPVNERW